LLKVIKRDCTEVDFDNSKIVNAILKSMKNGSGIVKPKIAEDIASEIYEENKDKVEISISDIESLVYNKLNSKEQPLTARAYWGYKSIREFQREHPNTTDNDVMELIGGVSDYWLHENSNKNAVVATVQRDYLAGITSVDIAKRFLLPADIVQGDEEGIIHFHDKDYYAQTINNCCLINLEDMLQNGTMINGRAIDKPHTFRTASTIATQIITAVTSSQYGGASITLSHLAPFVKDSYNKYIAKYQKRGLSNYESELYAKEDLKEEIRDGVQTFNYQINTMQTTNGQAPFITVFMYLNESQEYKKETAMITEEFLRQRTLGMKNEKGIYVTPAFPKLIYCLESDNISEDGEYWYLTLLAAKCTAKRMVPDYISEKVMLELKGDVYTCMGCRSFLTPDRTTENLANAMNYTKGHKYYGRFNQGVVTLNLVDLALSSEKDMDTFWKLFEERTELCHRALQCRHKRLEGTLSDVAPILWQNGAFARLDKHEPIDKLLHSGYSTISLGYAGLYECVKYMTGDSHTDNGLGKEFGLQVMQALNDKCNQWKQAEDIDYSLYGTPIESTTYTFAKALKKRFGVVEGITDRDYITNSYHVPVFEEIDAFTKLKLESEFQNLSPGGAISYIEVPNMQNNIEAIISVMQFIYENIMYAEINTKSDYCMECGYDGEIKIVDDKESGKLIWECPNCGNRDQDKMSVARRTCGYIGTQFWNQGRTEEIKERVLHL